ncbi:MAG TPA: glucuronate isomerase [Bacteroidota bacterium]|nr:glucuronate isomerase [Bacteroidota bacterium]
MKDIFITENFLLETKTSVELYHTYAKDLPIIDYHCHLSPKEIAENKKFENLTQIWLYGDHYKWRAMRTAGVPEKFITGNASDWEKFEKWAETVPKTIRNPLYHWTHLELKRPFGISDRLLNKDTAKSIWDECNAKLALDEFSTQGIIKQMKVEIICTTDDPTDTLEYHNLLNQNKTKEFTVFPAFRPDKGMMIDNPEIFIPWVKKLSSVTNIDITSFDDFITAIRKRHDYFSSFGCCLSDHGLETIYCEDYTQSEIKEIFDKALTNKALSELEILKFKSAMLYEFALMDFEKDWVQQFHLGVIRNNNTRYYKKLGPDTGFDSIGDFALAKPLAKFLDRLDSNEMLAKTILYNINPADNELFATMIGNFQDGSVPGKIQYGSAWWFLDQKSGMEKQLEALSNMGLLSQFIGMLTDSRSFLSYPRHEYFRRILCNILGNEIEKGLIPNEKQLIGEMIKDICYRNAKVYFKF